MHKYEKNYFKRQKNDTPRQIDKIKKSNYFFILKIPIHWLLIYSSLKKVGNIIH